MDYKNDSSFFDQIRMHKRMSPHGDFDHMGNTQNIIELFLKYGIILMQGDGKMFSSELYKKYIEARNKRYDLENKINDYIEKWKNGETVLSTKSIELAVEKGYERLEDLKKIEESIRQDFDQMSALEEQKKAADIGIRSKLGRAPDNMNIVGGVLSSNASESHLIAEKKSDEQMASEKLQMLSELKEKVKNGEISLAQASELSAKINSSFDFYGKEEKIQGRHM